MISFLTNYSYHKETCLPCRGLLKRMDYRLVTIWHIDRISIRHIAFGLRHFLFILINIADLVLTSWHWNASPSPSGVSTTYGKERAIYLINCILIISFMDYMTWIHVLLLKMDTPNWTLLFTFWFTFIIVMWIFSISFPWNLV